MNEYMLVLLGALSGLGVLSASRTIGRLALAGRRKGGSRRAASPSKDALREFIYLDEVQLRSLLASLTGEMLDTVSQSTTDAVTAEFAAAIGAQATSLAKAEGSSRLQASTTEMFQTSRKATVQSWFREFYKFDDIRLITLPRSVEPLRGLENLASDENPSVCCPSWLLERGELVEFRIVLRPDPTYRLSTLLVEFLSMAKEVPELMDISQGGKGMEEVRPLSKMLDQLLAGLIPIRAESLDYRVVKTPRGDVLAHVDSLKELEVESVPLEIVGVTEKACYWKDLRRILFSDVEVRALARVSRSGLHEEWSPVKLVELFEPVTPGLAAQITSLGRDHLSLILDEIRESGSDGDLNGLMRSYASEWFRRVDLVPDETEMQEVYAWIEGIKAAGGTVSAERKAFLAVDKWLTERFARNVPSADRIELRDIARAAPREIVPTPEAESSGQADGIGQSVLPKLLDVEFVAFYW